ncbi:hypothetical protein AB4570_22800, partial [Vibrio sp. 10N.222.49.F1]
FNIASFLSTEIRDTITLYRPNWLNFNSDNYPARGGEYAKKNGQYISSMWLEKALTKEPD